MNLFVSALEPSSNMHLLSLLRELDKNKNKNMPGIKISGIYSDFSNELKNLYFEPSLFHISDFSVMGFVDVLKRLSFFKNAQKLATKCALRSDLVLLLDGSSFHLRLAKDLKKHNFKKPIIYYILPQIWAWKPWRISQIMRDFTLLCAILPFELKNYESYISKMGLNKNDFIFDIKNFNAPKKEHFSKDHFASVVYVGHPLFDSLKLQNEQKQKNKKTDKKLIFMPGSRIGEIKRIFPILRDLAKDPALSGYKKILVIPTFFDKNNLDQIYGPTNDFELCFDTKKALDGAHFAFICSGTATLEAALLKVPFVLCYIAKNVDYLIAKNLLNIKFIGLANIMWSQFNDSFLHAELIQKDCNKQKLLSAFLDFDFDTFYKNVGFLRQYLGHGSAQNVSNILLQMYNQISQDKDRN
ncbi:MAG: lipid-A-disaccharide synthase [Helicobacter sp.]|nr:lipid-A-disaccharide synthase [Helicobacter sp.]